MASSNSIVVEDESDISNADSNNSSTSETSFETDVTQPKRKSDKERNHKTRKKTKMDQPATTVYLKKLLTKKGTMSMKDVRENSKSVSEWVEKIIEELKIRHKLEFDALKILKTGSNAEGLKINRPNEFDLMLVLKEELEEVLEIVFEDGTTPAGFAKLKKVENWSAQKFQVFEKFLADADEGSGKYLSASLLMKFFRNEVSEAVKRITGTSNDELASLKVLPSKENSPAVTISIFHGKRPRILVDLVLSIKVKGWPTTGEVALWGQSGTTSSWPDQVQVEKCRKEFHLVPKFPVSVQSSELLWRLSLSSAEKILMNPKRCGIQKECLKVAKLILCGERVLNKAIKSYYLKTVLMKMMATNPDDHWLKENLGPRVIDLLKNINKAICLKKLSHFFIPNLNLFQDLDDKQISSVELIINNVISDLHKDPKEYCEKILHAEFTNDNF